MRNQSRILEIRVIIRGEGANYLSSLDATISGITASRYINDAFPPVDGTERPPAIITTSVDYSLINNGENIYSDSKSLLGINGDASQMLDFNIIYQDGRESKETVDVTRGMDGFHTINYHEAWVLEFIIYAGPSEIGATIEDWRYGSASTMIAQ
ncbi:MAG: hypothetical protein LIO65_06510 [Odoribacter sp.]|nr:hypothetical protein [Odoribacter sp.]